MIPSLDYAPAWPCPRKDELTISVEHGSAGLRLGCSCPASLSVPGPRSGGFRVYQFRPSKEEKTDVEVELLLLFIHS
jgi:hypothetical protein